MRSILLSVAFSLLLAAAVGRDEVRVTYSPYTPPGSAGFRAETRVVETSAVVRDGHDRVIDLLQKRDFRILDDGKEREITSFAVQRPGGDAAQTAPPRVIALVFDDLAVKLDCDSIAPRPNAAAIASIALMKDAAEKFIRNNLRPEDRISIIGFSNGQTTPFTNDAAQLIAGIRKVDIQQTCSPANKIGSVEDVLDYMVPLRGNRGIVLCSIGFGAGRLALEEISGKAIRAQIPIHTLEMRGVGSLGAGALGYLANNTGGRNIYNNNDFDLGLRELLSPPAVAYQLGFTPDDAHDGRYHSLKIQLPGHKGSYAIEARPGYFAPDAKDDRPRTEAPIDRAVLAEDTRDDVPVSITAMPDRLVTGEPAVSVVAHVDLKRLAFRSRWDRHVQNLRLVVALLDSAGNFVAGKEGDLDFFLKDASLAELSNEGVNAMLTLSAPAGSYRVRMVMEEQEGKLTASNAILRIP